jgi:hypothetical protein
MNTLLVSLACIVLIWFGVIWLALGPTIMLMNLVVFLAALVPGAIVALVAAR